MAPSIKSAKLGRYVTKAGSSLFGTGNTPSPFDDTKVEGTIVLDAAAKDHFQAWLDERLTDELLKDLGIKRSELNSIFKDDVDKDKNPTGAYRVKGKSNIKYMPKFIGGDGKEFNPTDDFKIPNRATIQLSLGVEVMKMSTFTGIVLRLQGTKILEVPDYGTGFEDDDSEGSFSYDAAAPKAEAPKVEIQEDEIAW